MSPAPQNRVAHKSGAAQESPVSPRQSLTAAATGHQLAALSIGAPGDRYEQEADQAVEQIVDRLESGNSPAGPIQTTPTPGPAVQAKGDFGPGSGSAASGSAANALTQLPAALGSDRPIAPAVRSPMEQAFGANFGDVRLHTDAQAQQLNRHLNARATTIGRDIHFAESEFDPDTQAGRELLAHELTHVLQQRHGGRRLQNKKIAGEEQEEIPGPDQDDLAQVAVHNPPAEPAALNAQAYNPGHAIHVAGGQERHLAHEGWHVIQERQGHVAPAAVGGGGPVGDGMNDNNAPAPENPDAGDFYQPMPYDADATDAYQMMGDPGEVSPYLTTTNPDVYEEPNDDDFFYR